jgi:hypothetical protein
MDGIETAAPAAMQVSRAALIYQSEGEIIGGTETTVIRRRPVLVGQPVRSEVEHADAPMSDVATLTDAGTPWYVLELEPRGAQGARRANGSRASEVTASGANGSWELPLTPALARQLAEAGISLKSLHQAAREARKHGGSEPVLRVSLELR